MSPYPTLFSEGHIGGMATKNRLVMAPMVRNYSDESGHVTSRYMAHMLRIAEGGVGTMILENHAVVPAGKAFSCMQGAWSDDQIPGLRQLFDAVHARRARIGCQIYHAGRQTSHAITGVQDVAPSPIPDPTVNEVPRALTVEEIHTLVDAFGQAARRVREAGGDFVEIHGAHGYLVTEFLSQFSNVRDDQYGGNLENRMRFLVEIVESIRGAAGNDFPVIVRLSGEEMVPKGLTIEDTVQIARRLEMLRVDALHISAGNYASYERGYMIQPMAIPDGPLIPLAEAVKAAVEIPVIAVGKIRTPELAEETLASGKADFIAIGRSLLADPDWPRKAQAGESHLTNKCIACNQGCISRLFDNQDVWCTVNPACSREGEFARQSPAVGKRVMVVGGGPAGMAAAKVAAERGHQVTLFEEEDHLGGQLIAASAAPYRPGWAELRQYQEQEMARLPITVKLNTRVTPELVQEVRPDVAIIAVGSSPIRMKIPGIEGANVVNARDLLEGKAEARGRVIVAGGGCSGAQTAEYLATRGHQVTIVEMLGAIAPDAPKADRELLLARLQRLGVAIQMETKIMRVEEDGVSVERPTGEEFMPAETVVLCLGARPNDTLAEAIRPLVSQVIVVGDAVKARKVTEAVIEGGLAGLHAGEATGMSQPKAA